MPSERRRALAALAGLTLAALQPARAAGMEQLRRDGRLRIAVYNDFPPYSSAGRGIDVDLGNAIAARLGLAPQVVGYNAGEDMNDDLRNMVWKGHYLGAPPADLMLHVPVDAHLAEANRKVRIFAPYHVETIAVARNPQRVPPVAGSAAVALEAFTREKIGVEVATLPDSFLLGTLNGRLRDQVVHYRSVALAAAGLEAGEVAAVMAPRAELVAALGGDARFPITDVRVPELPVHGWALGMAVKADDGALADAVGRAVTELERDGTVAKIFAAYGIGHHAPGGE